MKVSKFMTKDVIFLTPRNSLYDCIVRFSKYHISGAPVINRKREVVGIVGESDVTKALDILTPSIRLASSKLIDLLFSALKSKKEEDQIRSELQQAKKVKVETFMTTPPITINQDASLMETIKKISSDDITRVPVIDDKGKLVGIVARADVIRALTKVQLHNHEIKA